MTGSNRRNVLISSVGQRIGIGLALLVVAAALTLTVASAAQPSPLAQKKQHVLQTLQTRAAVPYQRPSNLPALYNAIPKSGPMPARREGIFYGSQGLVPPYVFSVTSSWGGPRYGKWLYVWAGTEYLNPPRHNPQPAVKLATVPIDPNVGNTPIPAGDFYSTCGGQGLTITSVNGDSMQLRSDNGRIVLFDLNQHVFVCK
jgi:hypothetical protein